MDHLGPNLTICTDGLASMYMKDKHMRCPSLLKECKHEELLSLMVEELAKKAREGVHVQLLKVNSHIGIGGNEKADALAHEACKPEYCNDVASEGLKIRADIFWPHFYGKKIYNASGGAAAIVMDVLGGEQPSQAYPNRKGTAGQFPVNALRKGLKKILKAGCSRGFSNKTIYVLARMAARPHVQREISNHFWASPQVTTSMVTRHDSQVQVWPAVEHESSISATKAILSGSQNPTIR